MKMINVSKALDIDKILEYSGCDDSVKRTIIASDGFDNNDEISTLGDSEIVNLVKGLSDRDIAAGKISFGLRWTNLMK